MSRFGFRRRHTVLFLAGAASALIAVLSASAQEAGLRGPVRESEVTARLLSGNDGATDPLPTGSTGLPPSPLDRANTDIGNMDGGLFPAAGAQPAREDDPFQPLDATPQRRPPVTAVERERRRTSMEPAQEREAPEQAALDTLDTATILPTDAAEEEDLPRRLNERALPIETPIRSGEYDPYAPLGLRVGTLIVRPTLEQGLTWTSNADNSPSGEEAILSETTLRLNAVSDWARHRAEVNAFGTFRRSLSGEYVSDPEGGVDATLDFDLSTNLRGRVALGYSVDRESASSPVVIAGVEEQPLRHTIDSSLGLEKSLGRLRLGVTGEVSRDQYGDAELVGGGTLSQSDRDSTLALARLRAGYELSPALIPFVEIEAGRRIYDEEHDSAGYARSATRLGARAGLALDMSEKLSGELSAGWVSEDFEDSRLDTISGLALAASFDWSPQRGTIVGLDASTTVEGTTDAGESGSLLYAGTLRLERRMRHNLTGDLGVGAAYRDYAAGGHDLILSGEAALTWWLNRYAGLTGRARHERQTSSLPGRDYNTTSFFMGMRLQR